MKIKVAYIYDIFPQHYQSYIKLVMDQMHKQPDLLYKTYAFNAKDHSAVSLKYGLFKRGINKINNIIKSQANPLFIKELDRATFDIIHIQHSYLFNKFLNVFVEQNRKQKFVITLRGGDTYIKPWLTDRWRQLYSGYGRRIFFIVMSEHQKAYLEKWDVPKEQIFVIPISHNNKTKTDVINRLDQNGYSLRIVSVFRMTWEKNIQGNLLFIKKLIEKGLDIQYDIYGDGVDLGEVYYLVDRFQLHKHVNVIGKVSYEVLMGKLKSYHLILQLSVSEALSSSILEAQSFGIPAIISDSDGLPEAVIPGESAICYPFWEIDKLVADTIDLWSNKEKYIAFCEKSFESSQRFTVDKEIERLTAMYQQILRGN
ncbi:MAG: glycosyltransferase family 4 protein [Flavipsychrobacter sp.]